MDDDCIKRRKKIARQTAHQRRAHLSEAYQRQARQALVPALAALLATTGRANLHIAGYMPIKTEIDPLPALTALPDTYSLCLPVPIAKAEPLIFRQWQPADPLEVELSFDTHIPLSSSPVVVPDVLVVPMLAWSPQGYRLGYGGGFYDRTIAQLRPLLSIGVAYECQCDPQLPIEACDQALSHLITEQKTLSFSS